MNDFQIYNKIYSKLSLHKNGNSKAKSKNFPTGLKSIYITNSNGLEISSQYGEFSKNSKKNMLEENYKIKHITYNNSHNKNLSFPINGTSLKQNLNYKNKESSLIGQKNILFKKKFETYINKSKKEENSNNYNSRDNTNNNINLINNMNGIMKNKGNFKINIIPKKSNFKFINIKENNISLNLNKNIGKSVSKSKSKSKSKNKRENKSHNNNKIGNINNIILDKYLKIYKLAENNIVKKTKVKNGNFISKESPNYNISRCSNNSDIHKMSSVNMMNNINNNKGMKKKNKSSNLLITNINKPKNINTSKTNIIITKIESNNNKLKNSQHKSNNIDKKNNLNYLTDKHIMYLINKKNSNNKKRNNKNNKDKQVLSKEIKTDSNTNANTNNNYLNYNNIEKEQDEEKNKKTENIIYDYKSNNILYNKYNNNNINKNKKKNNLNLNNENINNTYKILNERLKTEYNENSLEAIDKMYEEEKTGEINQKSLSFSKHDSFRFFYPEIYNRDDEFFIEENNSNNDKREKELDETESPLKMDTDKVTNENSGVLSFDQVKDIICYYNMNNTDKQSDFLFQKNERQLYDINCKNKYLYFFFGNNINFINDKNNNNDLIEDLATINTNKNLKYPSSSIFSIDTDYSSKMKKKYNKNLVKNI